MQTQPALLLPLPSANPDNPLLGGYAFLDTTADGITPHPGIDLNSTDTPNGDCGLPVLAALQGVVLSTHTWPLSHPTGEGNHVWLQVTPRNNTPQAWAHYDHLNSILVTPGQPTTPTTPIGTCGRTGNWQYCHTHFELMRHAPPIPHFWPKGYTPAQIQEHYFDPIEYLAAYQAALPTTPTQDDALLSASLPRDPLTDLANALRLANLIKHEFEYYIVDADQRARVDTAADQEGNPPVVLMLRWAHEHYENGQTAP